MQQANNGNKTLQNNGIAAFRRLVADNPSATAQGVFLWITLWISEKDPALQRLPSRGGARGESRLRAQRAKKWAAVAARCLV